MPEQHRYICEQLSHKTSDVSKWVEKFIAIRLPGLQSDPKKTYQEESRRSIEEWISLLSKPTYYVVVCAIKKAGQENADIWDREWVGIMLVYGPQIRHRTSKKPEHQSQALYDILWFVGGVYVVPAHRAHNITVLLLEHSIHVKVEESSKRRLSTPRPSGVIVQGVVAPERKGLQEYYYKKLLFTPVRRMTRKEHCIQWGIDFDPSIPDAEVIILERQAKVRPGRL